MTKKQIEKLADYIAFGAADADVQKNPAEKREHLKEVESFFRILAFIHEDFTKVEENRKAAMKRAEQLYFDYLDELV